MYISTYTVVPRQTSYTTEIVIISVTITPLYKVEHTNTTESIHTEEPTVTDGLAQHQHSNILMQSLHD